MKSEEELNQVFFASMGVASANTKPVQTPSHSDQSP